MPETYRGTSLCFNCAKSHAACRVEGCTNYRVIHHDYLFFSFCPQHTCQGDECTERRVNECFCEGHTCPTCGNYRRYPDHSACDLCANGLSDLSIQLTKIYPFIRNVYESEDKVVRVFDCQRGIEFTSLQYHGITLEYYPRDIDLGKFLDLDPSK